MLGRGLVSCWGAGGLGLMNGARVVGEGLWSYIEEGIISIIFLLWITYLQVLHWDSEEEYEIYIIKESSRFSSAHRRCPAVGPEEHLLVQGTGGLLEDPRLVGVDSHLDLSSWPHSAAWSTLAGRGKTRTNMLFLNVLKCEARSKLQDVFKAQLTM